MGKNFNPYVDQRVNRMAEELKNLRFQLTGRGSAIVGGLLVDLSRLKDHAKPQCAPDENAVHRGCSLNG